MLTCHSYRPYRSALFKPVRQFFDMKSKKGMKEYRGTPSFPNDQIIYSYVIRDAIRFCLTFKICGGYCREIQ